MRTVALWNFYTSKHVINMGVGIEWKKKLIKHFNIYIFIRIYSMCLN